MESCSCCLFDLVRELTIFSFQQCCKINISMDNAKETEKDDEPEVDPTASWRWVPASHGQVPPNAVVGGAEEENLYIARAVHEGEVVPGKLRPSHGCCYVPWGSSEQRKTNYEVLCDANGVFVKPNNGSIPPNAYRAGFSYMNNEPVYIGRVFHNGTYILGKVSHCHGVCYYSYRGEELCSTDYQIYVSR